MTRWNEAEVVAVEYTSERGLEGRRATFQYYEGSDVRELAFDAIVKAAPQRMLEMGCGPGELAERVARELGAEIVAVDISPRMVELARGRGVDARVGDVQALPFDDASFDVVSAVWMLYHAPDVALAVAELARVLEPHGYLVAVTNGVEHLRELRELLELGLHDLAFSAENGEEYLSRHFATVERTDAPGLIRFPTRQSVLDYLEAASNLGYDAAEVPEIELPFVVRTRSTMFVAQNRSEVTR